MSYILDALRKADAERERGSVPGLHTQPVRTVSAQAPAPRRGVPLTWVAAGSAVVVAGALGWAWSLRGGEPRHEPQRQVEAPAPAVVASPPAVVAAPGPEAVETVPAPATPELSAPAQAAPAPAAPAPTAPARKAPVPAAQSQQQPAPVVTAPRAPAPSPASTPARRAAPRSATPSAVPAAPTPATAPSAADARVYTVGELPEHIRREWPQLSIGGSIYSETPASRFLIINGQIYHEGDKVGTHGMSLEQIKLKAAVLLYKGYRVGISY
jgi:general secretion pathway protein B